MSSSDSELDDEQPQATLQEICGLNNCTVYETVSSDCSTYRCGRFLCATEAKGQNEALSQAIYTIIISVTPTHLKHTQ